MVRRRPAGATHDYAGSGDYWLAFAPMIDVEIHGAEGRAAPPGPGGVAVQLGGGPRRAGLALCSRCQGFSRPGDACAGGVPHAQDCARSYVVALNAPTAPGQAHWRLCGKCQTLSFRSRVCFAGGTHDLTGSGGYTVGQNPGQNQWRHCPNCQGL